MPARRRRGRPSAATPTPITAPGVRRPAMPTPKPPPRRTAVHAAAARLPTKFGDFTIHVYRDVPTGKEHAAIVKGDVAERACPDPVLVRIHSECMTGDTFGSKRCDCGAQL